MDTRPARNEVENIYVMLLELTDYYRQIATDQTERFIYLLYGRGYVTWLSTVKYKKNFQQLYRCLFCLTWRIHVCAAYGGGEFSTFTLTGRSNL